MITTVTGTSAPSDMEQIKKNEYKNTGNSIHLYLSEGTDMWVAYGLSAYGLRLYGKSLGFGTVRSYSSLLQLPCTVADKDAVSGLLSGNASFRQASDTYLCLGISEGIDKDTYGMWASKLQNGVKGEDQIVVTTPVSHHIPRNRFIPDGMSSFQRNAKRVVDCVLAFFALIVFSPLFLFTWIAVRREDGGPAIYKQERIGRFGRPFFIYKFRSMRLDAEKMGPQLSHSGGDNDPRLTKTGKFIRAHHLDELPQLWNVFNGDMAFIGPRPERKFYIDQILEHDLRYTYLYQIRPGVTSYATLYNGYTDSMEKMLRRLEYDLYYLGHRSWFFDFRILFNTFCSIVFGKKF